MRPAKITNILFLLFIAVLGIIACNQSDQHDDFLAEKSRQNNLLFMNASQYGVQYPETFILMQNRYGMRIEYCVDRSDLQLWISPQAWKSLDYRDRNFSNRDDHCTVFDDIHLAHQKFGDFVDCDFDPFYSVINYTNQKIHMVNIFDKPAIVMWFENENGVIDFKAGNEDVVLSNTEKEFVVRHSERGKRFRFAAILSDGAGAFRHQVVRDEGRSTYCRAEMAPGQFLVIASELEQEDIDDLARRIANMNKQQLLKNNEEKVAAALETGNFQLKNHPEMQKLLEKNKRIALSMQDGGFMRSTNQYIYYLLWYRDGGMNTSHLCYSGWPKVAGDHVRIANMNPNTSYEEPEGEFFGQLMAGPITKWEEDGLFYATWPAFAHWTQTGDKTYISGEYLLNLEKAMAWLETHVYDEEKGLFGRYHRCETPFSGSRGFGWDNAVGRPTDEYYATHDGDTIVFAYDIYMNNLNYSTYLMLAAMEQANGNDQKSAEYLEKAKTLEKNINKWLRDKNSLPPYGDLLTKHGEMVVAGPYGMDETDYQWALSIPPFLPNKPEVLRNTSNLLLKDMQEDPKGMFICAYNAILTSMDPLIHDEVEMMERLEYLVPQSVRAGKYLAMPYTIPELVDQEDGDPFHDVRPLVYSIAPWISAVTNFGLHRMPFGIALRGTQYLDNLGNYRYKNALLDVNYTGAGEINEITINGQKLAHSYQIPDEILENGENVVEIKMSSNPASKNILAASTVQLNRIIENKTKVRFNINAYGQNLLSFLNLTKPLEIQDAKGDRVEFESQQVGQLTTIEFQGQGNYQLVLK